MTPSAKTWIITGVVAVVLIAGAFLLTRSPQRSAETALQETVPAQTAAVDEAPQENREPSPPPVQGKLAGTLKVSMPGPEAERGRLSLTYSCYRDNVSPPLNWSDAPRGTKSYAVFMGQKKEGGAPHLYWVRFNIPASATSLPEGPRGDAALGDGSRYGMNDHGVAGYAGPCDPRGTSTYVFRVFALDTVLDVPAGATKDILSKAMRGHILDVAEISLFHYKQL